MHANSLRNALWRKMVFALNFATPPELSEYLGQHTALAIAWLQSYTWWLAVPALFGLILFLYEEVENTVDNLAVPLYSLMLIVWYAHCPTDW